MNHEEVTTNTRMATIGEEERTKEIVLDSVALINTVPDLEEEEPVVEATKEEAVAVAVARGDGGRGGGRGRRFAPSCNNNNNSKGNRW